MNKIFDRALRASIAGVLCFACVYTAHSQTSPPPIPESQKLPTVIQPSPTAASLGKYGDIPVGYHTGTANISVPLYEVKEGPVTVPISLNYHTAGIRVAEASSWVGLGWALNCGGVITRTVQHVPDEGPLTITVPQSVLGAENVVHSGYYTDGYILPEHLTFGSYDGSGFADPAEWLAYRQYICAAAGDVDAEPDLFFYNFGNYSGKFFFKVEKDGQGNLIRTPVFIPKADVKVDVTFGPTTVPTRDSNLTETRDTFSSFVLTTPDGFKYYFGGDDAIEFSGTESNNTKNYEFNSLVKLAPSSWYLTKLESPDGHVITLEYAPDKYSFFDIGGERCWSGAQFLDMTNQTVMRTVISGLQLSRIATTNEEILFQANTVRQDLSDYDNNGGGEEGLNHITTKMLDRIVVKKLGGENTKVFDFHHSYFECSDNFLPHFLETGTQYDRDLFVTDTKRLKLDSVVEKSGDLSIVTPGHAFTYRETSASGSPRQLPRRMSFQQDHWGYFNGKSQNKSLIAFYAEPRNANRDTDDDYSNIGILTSIKYPTGGKSVFEYESNTSYGLIDDHVDNPSTNYGASVSLFSADPSEVTTSLDLMDGIPTPNSSCAVLGLGCYTLEATITIIAGDPRIPNSYDLDYSLYSGDVIAAIYDESGQVVRAFFVGDLDLISTCQQPSCSFYDGRDPNGPLSCDQPNPSRANNYLMLGRMNVNVELPPGKYYLKSFRIDGAKRNCSAKQVLFTSSLSVNVPALRDRNYQVPAHYGLRKIGGLRIKTITNTDRANNVTQRSFTYPATGGVLFGMPTYFYQVERIGAPPWANVQSFDFWDTQVWGSSSILAMQSTQGSHLGYETVEEHQTGNGFSRYTYDVATHPYNFQIPQDPYYAGNFSNYTSTDRYFNYPPYPVPLLLERGNLLKEEQYTEQSSLVHKKESVYETGQYEIVAHATKVEFIYGATVSNPLPGQEQMGDLPTYTNYPIYTGSSRLLTETETTYTTGGDPLSVVTEYKYESPKHLQTTEIKKSYSTRQEVLKMIYPPDYGTMTTGVAGIQNLANLNMINVPIEQYKIRQGLAGENPVVTEGTITTFKEAIPLRDAVKTLSIASPIPVNSFNPSNKTVSQFNADTRYEDRMTFNRYGIYSNIEEVSKTNDTHVSYIWGYNQSLPIAEIKNANRVQVFHTSFEDATTNFSNEAKTGSKSSSAAYTVVLPSAGTYKLTYWTKVGSDPWVLTETNVSADTSIGGTGILIDEVRLFPAGAQMTTYTYDTSAGMTTMTDPNNVVTHYYYDAFKRLQYITDDKGNVLKTLNYHYRNQSGN